MAQNNAVDAAQETKEKKKTTVLSRISKTVKNAFSQDPVVKRFNRMKKSNEKTVSQNKNHGEGLVDEAQKTKTDTLFIIKNIVNPTMPRGIKILNPENHLVSSEDSRILATEFGITHGFKNGGKVKTVFSKLKKERKLADLNVMEYAYKNPEAFIMGLHESHHNLFQKDIFFGEPGKSAKGFEYIVGLRADFIKGDPNKATENKVFFTLISKKFNDELDANDHFVCLKN